jgi:heme a synthase
VSQRVPAWLHRFAVLVVAATFLLIIAGGNVTSKGAGMSVPDWPRSFGSFNPNGWTTNMDGTKPGVRAEHAHRLIGATLGLLVVVLMIGLHRAEPRAWVRRLGYLALAGVIIQGLMGGLRVREVSLPLAIVHGCFAQAFFCLAVVLAAVTSPRYSSAGAQAGREIPGAATPTLASGSEPDRLLRLWSGLLVGAVYLQLVLGAIYRQTGSGLILHIGGALAVGAILMQLSPQVFRRPLERDFGLSKLLLPLLALFVLQVVLGVLTFVVVAPIHLHGLSRQDASPAAEYLPTVHLTLGTLIMGWTVYLAMRARLAGAMERPATPEPGDLRGAIA